MKIKYSKHTLAIVNTLAVLLVVGVFFAKPGYLFFTDYVVGPHMSPDPTSGWFYADTLFSFLSHIISAAFLQKCIFVFLSYLLLVSGNKLAERFTKNTVLIILGGLFAFFNPFVYERMMYGQVGVLLGLGFCIMGFAHFIDFLQDKKYTGLSFAGLFFGFAILFSNHYIFIILLLVILSFVFFWRVWSEHMHSQIFWKHIAIAGVAILLINGLWLISTFAVHGNAKQGLLSSINQTELQSFEISGNTSFDSLKLGVMMSGFWGKDQHRFIDVTQIRAIWGRGFILLVPFFMIGIYVFLSEKKRRNFGIFLLLIFLCSLFLALGVKSPATSGVTEWLFKHIPFYVGMRETQKWISLVVLVYIVFLTAGLEWLYDRHSKGTERYICSAVVGLAIIMQAPLLLFGFAGQVSPVQYPVDWQSANQLIVSQDTSCAGTSLFLPWHMYMSFSWIHAVVQSPAKQFFTCPVVQGTDVEWGAVYDDSGNPQSVAVESWINSAGTAQDPLVKEIPSLQYVILAKEADWEKYAWIDTLPYIHLVFDGPTVRVYRINK